MKYIKLFESTFRQGKWCVFIYANTNVVFGRVLKTRYFGGDAYVDILVEDYKELEEIDYLWIQTGIKKTFNMAISKLVFQSDDGIETEKIYRQTIEDLKIRLTANKYNL